MLSAGACSFCMIMISVMLYVKTTPNNWVFVAFCFIFFDVFSWGILPVSWMCASEIMPLSTRNKGVTIGAASHWISNFVIVYITPQAIENLQYRLYIIWAVFNASFVPITYFFYPETARRSLEGVDEIFQRERFGVTHTRKPGSQTVGAVARRRESIASQDVDEKRTKGADQGDSAAYATHSAFGP
jgi:Sugar (and other) transporter